MQKFYSNVALLDTPTDGTHLVNKKYVDMAISRKVKDPVVAVSGSNIDATYNSTDKTLTQTNPDVLVIDDVTVAVGDRVLIAGQTDATQNGIYVVEVEGDATTAAVLKRADDFDETSDIMLNVMIPIQQGKQNADSTWVLTNDTPVTLDSSPMSFATYKSSDTASKFTGTFDGDGTTKQWVITHGLNTEMISVSILDAVSKEPCYFDFEVTSPNTITIYAGFAPDSGDSFVVTIVG